MEELEEEEEESGQEKAQGGRILVKLFFFHAVEFVQMRIYLVQPLVD